MTALFEIEPSDVAATNDDWYTPRWVFDAAGLTFDMDVAAPVDPSRRMCPARAYLTPVEDGLTAPWRGMVWCNPPYSRPAPWMERFAAHPAGMALVPAARSRWLGVLMAAADAVALISCVFGRPDGRPASPGGMALVLAARGGGMRCGCRKGGRSGFDSGRFVPRPTCINASIRTLVPRWCGKHHRGVPNLCERSDMDKSTRGSLAVFLQAHLPDERVAARFWAKVDKSGPVPEHCPALGPCWVWTAGTDRKGYGLFGIGPKGGNRCFYAHRVSLALAGTIPPDDLVVRHHCDNPPCVNPDHLALGTRLDNNRDMAERGRHWSRQRTHCGNGHDLRVPGATSGADGAGVCVQCKREHRAAWELRNSDRVVADDPRTHCTKGHELTPENTYDNHGRRGCRTCRSIAWHARKLRKKQAA